MANNTKKEPVPTPTKSSRTGTPQAQVRTKEVKPKNPAYDGFMRALEL